MSSRRPSDPLTPRSLTSPKLPNIAHVPVSTPSGAVCACACTRSSVRAARWCGRARAAAASRSTWFGSSRSCAAAPPSRPSSETRRQGSARCRGQPVHRGQQVQKSASTGVNQCTEVRRGAKVRTAATWYRSTGAQRSTGAVQQKCAHPGKSSIDTPHRAEFSSSAVRRGHRVHGGHDRLQFSAQRLQGATCNRRHHSLSSLEIRQSELGHSNKNPSRCGHTPGLITQPQSMHAKSLEGRLHFRHARIFHASHLRIHTHFTRALFHACAQSTRAHIPRVRYFFTLHACAASILQLPFR